MRPRRSTWIWLGVLVAAEVTAFVLRRAGSDAGCFLKAVSVLAFTILFWRAAVFLFRLIIRRLSLRLAFSHFLIGIVPIPLTAALALAAGYIVAHQFVATRMRREMTALGLSALSSAPPPPRIALGDDGTVRSSGVSWLPAGAKAEWLRDLERPGFVEAEDDLWLAIPDGARAVRLVDLSAPEAPWTQRLADATGYEVELILGDASTENRGLHIETNDEEGGVKLRSKNRAPAAPPRRPHDLPTPGRGWANGEWIHAFYLETLANAAEAERKTGHNVAILKATTSPEIVVDQLFHQGVAGISRIFWVVFVIIAAMLLVVYLVAVAIAFVLVASIARNVNRLTRATQAVARGDFSVRVGSKSRDQIGDLARSFDGMADNIQGLLRQTAQKERLESEIAMARTIQHKLLPAPEASLTGLSILAHLDPVAEIGGDYYDYIAMPDGHTALLLGDVSGHGLPTGLLVAMAKAAVATLIESGHRGSELLARLNEVIHRSTDPRHFMTLCLLAYDSATRRGTLTNAGQLAPYRVSGDRVEPLALPALPLGLFPDRTFPSRDYAFSAGDLLVFYSDGFIEATNAADDPFGYERFEAALRRHGAEGAAAVRDAILAALAAHTGARPQDDDRTLMIVTLD
ncbi:MAG TPA: SpoIIE family protein phosphatase [Thermoanaerobaculia bacterium]